jgi:hypothetical protein
VSPIDSQKEVEQRMDEAFAAGPGSAEERELQDFLARHPEYHALWKEYQTLRRGMDLLQDRSEPSEVTRARIHRLSREHLQKTDHAGRRWRWLLSQPMIAAATVLLAVGFGIYSQYLFKETKKFEENIPVPKKQELAVPTPAPAPAQVFEKKTKSLPKVSAPQPAPAPVLEPPKALAPAADSAGGAGMMRSISEEKASELKALQASPRKDEDDLSFYDQLLAQAKDKIASEDCPGALKLLQEAQSLKETPELRDLIRQCTK